MPNNNKSTATTVLAVLVTLAVAGTGGYMIGNRTGQTSASVSAAAVATVNNDKITKIDLYDHLVAQNGPQAIDQMITDKLVHQAATAAKVTVSEQDIDAAIAKLVKDNFAGDNAQLDQALQQNNLTMKQLRDIQRVQLEANKILGKDIPADDATLQKYFTDNTAQFDKREVHARHILVATEEEAKAIKGQLDNGGDFAALAKEKSTEPAAKTSGGDLGFFGHGKMDAAFETAAFNMKVNEISAPVQSQFGWHVIQVLETKGAAPDFAAAKNDVKEAYVASQVSQKMQPWLDDLKTKAKITNTLAPAAPAAK